jgi:hypothetical protein
MPFTKRSIEIARVREGRAARVVVCNRFADEGGTLFGTAGQEASEFGDRLRSPRDLAKNRIVVMFTILRISLEKLINSMLFQAVSPPLRPQSIQANNQYIIPQKIEGE